MTTTWAVLRADLVWTLASIVFYLAVAIVRRWWSSRRKPAPSHQRWRRPMWGSADEHWRRESMRRRARR